MVVTKFVLCPVCKNKTRLKIREDGCGLESCGQGGLSSCYGKKPYQRYRNQAPLEKRFDRQGKNRQVFMKGIDHSYYYEGYTTFKTEDLK